MTITERNIKLKYFIACLKCEVNGRVCDDNCPTQYEAGNMGEIIENLEAISKILEQEPKTGHWIPVSERLPEESDYVSCLPFYDGVVIWITNKGIMGFGWYYNSTNNWADTNDCWSDKYGEVIAWMSLPLRISHRKVRMRNDKA